MNSDKRINQAQMTSNHGEHGEHGELRTSPCIGETEVKKPSPIHPGEILLEEFLTPMNLSQYRLAKDISVSPRRINEIVHGERAITAETALRLSRYFGMSEKFWLNLQMRYDLENERIRMGVRLEKEVKPRVTVRGPSHSVG